ncbi:histidine triad (HIT) family protein [Natranaerovirga hydrolytica]|uniref:Histidine triad (HIT) family protein n=1 Tax=Natranaerovirga hydrolytica TaxID=680378 RepID=A0A4R1MMK6_9FIRM|nr:HIT family protein [Natranaerovirga hydrolytica]TCK93122.1 histidine triad (HIT) family protein [Natranaerovirga hydrolytica]
MSSKNCIFCNIISGDMKSATVFENSEFKVIMDRFPASKGHTLIMPKEHVENIFDIETDVASRLFALATQISKILKQTLNCEGMNVLQNNGSIAGQTVDHFHLHLMPRYKDDKININWENLQVTEEDLEEVAKEIGRAL